MGRDLELLAATLDDARRVETCAKPILNAKNVCDRDEWKRQGDVVPTIIRTMSVCLKQAYVNCQGCTKEIGRAHV